ncbi:T9SS type A sorting domain-containing protein [Ferruginibacter sp. SUN106]|uniref:T9SS type A sorting domain-containing protein n=1 Tax=Ferruginibacter sp. SUN106 TaxID=2978348 RepID=UPI003D36772A
MKPFIVTVAIVLFFAFSATAQLFVQAGAVIKTTGNAVITLQDIDLVNNGTINQLSGEGKFVFTGAADNTISGSNIPLFDIMEIAKTGTAKISLLQNINIGTAVNFTSGLINLNNSTIYLQPTALLNGENENSRITGTGGGYVEITNILNAPPAINPGNLGAIITSSQNLGSTIIRRGHTSQVNGSNAGNSIYRYYDIIPTNNTALNATLRLNYFDTELNGLTENNLTLWKSNNNTTWVNMGFTVRDALANYVGQSGLADFSRWTLSSANNPLPVHFLLFAVSCNSNAVNITWKTAQEQNSKNFAIQKSDDGIHFTIVGIVAAAGNSSTEKTYSFTDNSTSYKPAFYKIVETDIDGKMQYTAINRIQCGAADNELKTFPNPVKQTLFVNVNTRIASPIFIKIFDSKGALVLTQNNKLLSGNNQLNINMANLAAGIYSIALDWNNGQEHKIIKLQKQ